MMMATNDMTMTIMTEVTAMTNFTFLPPPLTPLLPIGEGANSIGRGKGVIGRDVNISLDPVVGTFIV